MAVIFFDESNRSSSCLPPTTRTINHTCSKIGLWKIKLENEISQNTSVTYESYVSVQEKITSLSMKVTLRSTNSVKIYLIVAKLAVFLQ